MSEIVYRLTLEPESVADFYAYVIDRSGEPPVTTFADAQEAFEIVASQYDGYLISDVKQISKDEIPSSEHPYTIGD